MISPSQNPDEKSPIYKNDPPQCPNSPQDVRQIIAIQPSPNEYCFSHTKNYLKFGVQKNENEFINNNPREKGLKECQVQCRKNTLHENQSLPRFMKENSLITDECVSFRSKDIGCAIDCLFQISNQPQ